MNRLFLLLFGAVSLVAHAQVPDYVPTEGLVAWYPFNGNANDESGNGYHGLGSELNTENFATDRFGVTNQALSLSQGQFVECPNWFASSPNQTAWTMAIWIKNDGADSEFPELIIGHRAHFKDKLIQIENDSIIIGNDRISTPLNITVTAPINPTDLNWHHLSLTSSADKLQLFFDGELVTEAERNGQISNWSDSYYGTFIGGNGHDPNWSNTFLGDLDDAGIWNRALTEEEILALYYAEFSVPGCTDWNADNYNPNANVDDGSCLYSGCMDLEADNYDSQANTGDQEALCEYNGCTNPEADNFDPGANADDGSCMVAGVPYYMPTEGLVAWYPFNGNANDESGNGNDGWNQGATPTTDRFDESDHAYAYSTSSNVELPSNSLASSFSFSVWFEAFEPSGEYILDSRINNEAGFAFLLGDSETIQFGFTAQGQYGDIIELQGLTVGDSSWHHAVFTFENDTLKTILDNEIIYSGAQAQETFSSGGTIKLGVRYDYSGHWLEGKIDDIGIWTTALTEEQITALYNAQLTLPGCTDWNADNYDAGANVEDGSCLYTGCMNAQADNYDPQANTGDQEALCEYYGCTNEAADNYDPNANVDDGSCIVAGCMYEAASNYNAIATYDNFSCEFLIPSVYCGEGTYWDDFAQACLTIVTCQDDLDGDGVIGVNDLMQLLSSFGTDCAPAEDPETAEWTCGDPVSYHGYDYATVQIGEQCWFAENLRTEFYQNGDGIPLVLNDIDWDNIDGDAARCSAAANAHPNAGQLYTFFVVSDERGVCPSDWHVPSHEEWIVLELDLGLDPGELENWGESRGNLGLKMKSCLEWNGDCSMQSGFNAVYSSIRPGNGPENGDYSAQEVSAFWSSTPNVGAWYRSLKFNSSGIHAWYDGDGGDAGYSIRCLKD